MLGELPTLVQVRAERARRRLAEFIRYGWAVLEPGVPLDWNWHIEAIADHAQAALEDWMRKQRDPSYQARYQNLLINVPPGTGKSRIIGVFLTAWMWLHWPSWRVILLSSNPRVAMRDSVYTRQVIHSEWYHAWFSPGWGISAKEDAKGKFANTEGGYRQALGFTARITGDRADALIVDDPHDAEEVQSKAMREAVLERWDSAIANRVNDLRSSVRLGIMQRLHEADWSGHVLAQGGWEHLCLPMEFEPERARTTAIGWRDPRTAPGEVLHLSRFPQEVLAAERRRLGSYGYAGQMQQRPAPAEGGMFRKSWWRYYDELPFGIQEWLISADLSFGSKADGASYVVFQLWGRKGANRYLVAQRRARMDFAETKKAFREFCAAHPQAGRKVVENKANGPAIISELRSEIAGIVAEEVSEDKQARAIANTPEIEAGNVFIPRYRDALGLPILGRQWVEDFVEEHAAFPNGANDDQVDATSQALKRFKGSGAYDPDEWKTRNG